MRTYALLALLPFVAALPSLELKTREASGELVGPDSVPGCDDIQAVSGADWLIAPLCAIINTNTDWPLLDIDLVGVELGTAMRVPAVNVRTYNSSLGVQTTSYVKYADSVGGENDNVQGAWIGGAFDQALIAIGTEGVVNGQLINATTATAANVDYDSLGVTGLRLLTGIQAVKEAVPNSDDGFWAWVQLVTNSPMVLKTTPECTALPPAQYFTVRTYTEDQHVTVWNPLVAPADSNSTVALGALRTCSSAVYHLQNWAQYTD